MIKMIPITNSIKAYFLKDIARKQLNLFNNRDRKIHVDFKNLQTNLNYFLLLD